VVQSFCSPIRNVIGRVESLGGSKEARNGSRSKKTLGAIFCDMKLRPANARRRSHRASP
jgi:hypothetical protein